MPPTAPIQLAERYDWLSIAILRFLDRVIRTCDDYKVTAGVCGEMGGRTLEAMALLGLGVKRLSITPASIGPVKAMMRSLDLGALRAAMPAMLNGRIGNLRDPLTQWAQDNAVELN